MVLDASLKARLLAFSVFVYVVSYSCRPPCTNHSLFLEPSPCLFFTPCLTFHRFLEPFTSKKLTTLLMVWFGEKHTDYGCFFFPLNWRFFWVIYIIYTLWVAMRKWGSSSPEVQQHGNRASFSFAICSFLLSFANLHSACSILFLFFIFRNQISQSLYSLSS